jgi:hypothetical protein
LPGDVRTGLNYTYMNEEIKRFAVDVQHEKYLPLHNQIKNTYDHVKTENIVFDPIPILPMIPDVFIDTPVSTLQKIELLETGSCDLENDCILFFNRKTGTFIFEEYDHNFKACRTRLTESDCSFTTSEEGAILRIPVEAPVFNECRHLHDQGYGELSDHAYSLIPDKIAGAYLSDLDKELLIKNNILKISNNLAIEFSLQTGLLLKMNREKDDQGHKDTWSVVREWECTWQEHVRRLHPPQQAAVLEVTGEHPAFQRLFQDQKRQLPLEQEAEPYNPIKYFLYLPDIVMGHRLTEAHKTALWLEGRTSLSDQLSVELRTDQQKLYAIEKVHGALHGFVKYPLLETDCEFQSADLNYPDEKIYRFPVEGTDYRVNCRRWEIDNRLFTEPLLKNDKLLKDFPEKVYGLELSEQIRQQILYSKQPVQLGNYLLELDAPTGILWKTDLFPSGSDKCIVLIKDCQFEQGLKKEISIDQTTIRKTKDKGLGL